ncbi:hypothetical protein HNR46_001304 [Haloferula luteola]|uniref:DUF3486 family protein n=1 Tax=Haloferula luteola TaxID=595692 RepID=A0A840VAV1_9BACT|nr:hypothetical protein [Haloferula luteola]MBB5351070.1 hypothetical protein [Haloferula luteola]
MARTHNGKIGRLPHALRREVNQRLLDGQTSTEILGWLNAESEAVRVWEAHFEGMPASAENLSNWRTGGYRKWLRQQEQIEAQKELSDYCRQIASAGGHVSEGLAARIGGELMEAIETAMEVAVDMGEGEAEAEAIDPVKRLTALTGAIASLRQADIAADRVKLDKQKTTLKAQAQKLDREKFERQTVEKFVEWAKSPAAQSILESGKPRHVQMDALRQLMFGKEVAA